MEDFSEGNKRSRRSNRQNYNYNWNKHQIIIVMKNIGMHKEQPWRVTIGRETLETAVRQGEQLQNVKFSR